MLTIQLENVQSKGLEIKPIQNYFDLTSSESTYDKCPYDGGITVIPVIKIEDVNDGIFYITQICEYHKLEIRSNTQDFVFESKEHLRDTSLPSSCHYKYHRIRNNQIMNELGSFPDQVKFFDAPFIELFNWWEGINYEVHFKTIFQYSRTNTLNDAVKPILSFNWKLKASANKIQDTWQINNSEFSDSEEIRKSIVHYSPDDEPYLPCELKHLGSVVRQFKNEIPELRSDFNPY